MQYVSGNRTIPCAPTYEEHAVNKFIITKLNRVFVPIVQLSITESLSDVCDLDVDVWIFVMKEYNKMIDALIRR